MAAAAERQQTQEPAFIVAGFARIIEEKVPSGKYPKVTKKVGKSPPQYPDDEE